MSLLNPFHFQFFLPKPRINEERMKYLMKLPDILLQIYCSLHGITLSDRDTNISNLAITTPLDLEKYIDLLVVDAQGNYTNSITDFGLGKAISQLGLCVPRNVNAIDYFIKSLPLCRYIFINPISQQEIELLKSNTLIEYWYSYMFLIRMKDIEIIDAIGVVPAYTSREKLIAAAGKFLCGIPIFCLTITKVPCNTTTYLLNNIKDVQTICYGYKNDIRAFEEDEFIMNIEEHRYDRLILKIPGNDYPMIKSELKELDTLLNNVDMFPNLASRIKLIIERSYPSLKDLKREIDKLTLTEKADIIKFLSILFDTGLAMRGWKPGDAIPYNKEETYSPAEETTSKYLIMLINQYDSMNQKCKFIIDSFLMYKMNILTSTVLMDRIKEIIYDPDKVTSCIRVNSRFFIETAYVYLLELFKYKIDNFSLDSVEYIE